MTRRIPQRPRLRVRELESRQLLSGLLVPSGVPEGGDLQLATSVRADSALATPLFQSWNTEASDAGALPGGSALEDRSIEPGGAAVDSTLSGVPALALTGLSGAGPTESSDGQPAMGADTAPVPAVARSTQTSTLSHVVSPGLPVSTGGARPRPGSASDVTATAVPATPQSPGVSPSTGAPDEIAQTASRAPDAHDDLEDLAPSIAAVPSAGPTGRQSPASMASERATASVPGVETDAYAAASLPARPNQEEAPSEAAALPAADAMRLTNLPLSNMESNSESAQVRPVESAGTAEHFPHGAIPDVLMALVTVGADLQYTQVVTGLSQLAAIAPEALLTGILPVDTAALEGALEHFLQTLEQVGQSVTPALDQMTLGYWVAGAAALGTALEVVRRRSGLYGGPPEAGDLSSLVLPGLPTADPLPSDE